MKPPSSWGQIRPSRVAWQSSARAAGSGLDARELDAGGGPALLALRFDANRRIEGVHCPSDALALVTRGELARPGHAALRAGDLCFLPAREPMSLGAGALGAELILLGLAGEARLAQSAGSPAPSRAVAVRPSDVPWQEFADAHGRPTEPVRVLYDGGPWVLGAKFRPSFSAGEHWHDWDTVYFVTRGEMRFGPQEPLYVAGDVRWVSGGHAYGPEQPGPAGVEFTLVSLGGPVNLRWADLEPAPHGRLA